jgi:hypothetical protein
MLKTKTFDKIAAICTSVLFVLFICTNINLAKNLPVNSNIDPGQNSNVPELAQKVADAYGVNNFSKVKSISYTFNVEHDGKHFQRSWIWEPKTGEVTFMGKNNKGKEIKVTYNRNKSMDEATKKIDAGFINDEYWLLFPYHLVWDGHVDIKDEGMKKYPIGKGEGDCLVVRYIGKVGYTPDDVFKLYVDKSNHIHQWVYEHHGNSKSPSPATWQGNKNFKGLIISTIHYGPGKKFKLWFSNVKVELE